MSHHSTVDLEEGRAGGKLEADIDEIDLEADREDALQPDAYQTEKTVPQPSSNKAHLHGLRGLAALMVYIGHNVSWWYGPGGPLEHGFGYHGEKMFGTFPFIRSLFTGGAAAVAIFFVLSGYVLSISPLLKLHNGQHRELYRSLVSAFIRRPFRLYIPLAGVSLTFALVMHLPFGLAPHLAWPQPEPTVWAELWKWFGEFASMMNPFKRYGIGVSWFPYCPPAWTMSAEFKGSIAVFGLLGVFSLAPSRYRIWLFSATGVLLLAILEWVVACFMFGVVLATIDVEKNWPNPPFHRLPKWSWNIICSALLFLAWWILCQPADPDPEFSYATPGWYYMTKIIPPNYYNYENWRFWNSIGAVLLVYSLSNLRWAQSFFCWRCMQFLGKISFPLYLVHMPIIWTVGDRVCRLLGVKRQEFTTWFDDKLAIPDVGPQGLSTGFLMSQMVIFPLSVLFALTACKLLDQPGIELGHWIVARTGLDRKHSSAERSCVVNNQMVHYAAVPMMEWDASCPLPDAPEVVRLRNR